MLSMVRGKSLVGLLVCLLFAFPTGLQAQTASPCCGGIIVVADGAGDSVEASNHLRDAVKENGLPLQVIRWPWSHGRFRSVADQTDEANLRAHGRQMAEYVLAYRQQNPGAQVYLVGHSAGALVALSALECSPPGVVDRAFLFAPSTSACYDVRLALRNVKCGLHSYYSRHDLLVLGLGTFLVGNADSQRGPAAGRIGFNTYACSAEDYYLYGKFYQRGWTHQDRALGNQGNHYGDYQPAFLRCHVIPWMRGI